MYFIFLILTSLNVINCEMPSNSFDVVVYGSSPAGIAAAVAAGRLGMKVALLEPLKMIGGMGAAGNLALNDGGTTAEKTGLALNFTLMNGEYYYGASANKQVPHPESFVANSTFYKMLDNSNVKDIFLDCRLQLVTTKATTISSISVSCLSQPISAVVFIDASYDGEIMVGAKNINYTFGRESIATYNESLAGARKPGWSGVGGPRGVDPFDSNGKLMKYVDNITELVDFGESDDRLMAFQHRMCISGEANRIPWPKPKNYNENDFLLLQKTIDADHGNANFFSNMPPSKLPGLPSTIKKYCLCCGITIYSTDNPVLNKGWSNATYEQKLNIIEDHKYFELGSFYYLANSNNVPITVRNEFNKYGLCSDEFIDNNYIPYQLYVRISNRLVGDYVMTQNNIANPRIKEDSIGVGDWSFDQHMTGRYAVPIGTNDDGTTKYEVTLEGNFWPTITPTPGNSSDHRSSSNWYDVPYRIMIPKKNQGTNLLIPVALSASAVAFSSTRIENMYMSVGTAAGVAAQQLILGTSKTVQDVNVTLVQEILIKKFQQRVHGPPGGQIPPAPIICNVALKDVKGVEVNGAGEGNGKYFKTNTILDGMPMFQLGSGLYPTHQLYRSNGLWRIATYGKSLLYLSIVGENNNGPPPASIKYWSNENGKHSIPTNLKCIYEMHREIHSEINGTLPPTLPPWKPTYNLSMSTITMQCNGSGYSNASRGASFGITSYDWSNAKKQWAMQKPMDDEERLLHQAIMTKRESKSINTSTKVFVYRNVVKALPWFSSVRKIMMDPSYSGFFLKFKNNVTNTSVPRCAIENTSKCSIYYHDQEQTPEVVHGDGTCPKTGCDCGDSIPCGEYLWDHRNGSQLSNWLINNHIISSTSIGNGNIDGMFIDDYWCSNLLCSENPQIAGCPCNDPGQGPTEVDRNSQIDMGLSDEDIRDITVGWNITMGKVQQSILNNNGYTWSLIYGQGNANASPTLLKKSTCVQQLRSACGTNKYIWQDNAHLVGITLVNGTNFLQLKQDISFFQLVRGPFAWIGWGVWGMTWPFNPEPAHGELPPQPHGVPRPSILEHDFGIPVVDGNSDDGTCYEIASSGIFQRKYSKGMVELNCNTFTANW
jgi:hypothetical protein